MNKMKKYIYSLFAVLLATATMSSCKVEEGTEPGNDAQPNVVMYSYTAKKPYNEDNDVAIRMAFNNKVEAAYYLVEKATEKESRLASMGAEGYMDYVVSNGTKVADATGETDIMITDLYGKYAITAVAVNGSQKSSAATEFIGLEWEDVIDGTYYFDFGSSLVGMESHPTTLQICTTDATLYRFKDVFGEGFNMKINLLPDYTMADGGGTYTYFRVPAIETPFTHPTYGVIGIRDIGYWQGSEAWVTTNGYESGMYEDYNCFVYVQYYVSAGNLGYGYDYFVPNK